MDMSSLFPSENAGGVGAAGGANAEGDSASVHVSFKAGILNLESSTKRMTADPRPGLFQIRTSMDDGLVHIQWKPRGAQVEKDLILIYGEAEMKPVMSCPSTARVYALKWRESDTRLFLWMQERNASEDATRVTLVNNILENGPSPQQLQFDNDDQQSPNDINTSSDVADTPMPPLPDSATAPTPVPPLTTSPDTAAEPPPPQTQEQATSSANAQRSTGTGGNITLEQIRAALSGGMLHSGVGDGVGPTPTPRDLLQQSELMREALEDPAVQSRLHTLYEDVPINDRSGEGIRSILHSNELESQAASLSAALSSGHDADDLLRSLGIELDSGGSNSNIPLLTRSSAANLIDALRRIQRSHKRDDQ